MVSSNEVKIVQKWIKGAINDPLGKTLLINSQFTKIQLETLLIDVLAERILERKISYSDKVQMRLTDKKISRGAYNRTLHQARSNMMKSVWTVLLLGYIGLLETPSLSPFIETSNKLETYLVEYNKLKNASKDKNKRKNIKILQNNLKEEISNWFPNK